MKNIQLSVSALVALALGFFPFALSRAQPVPAKPESADYSLGAPEGQPMEAAVSQLMEQAGATDLTAPNVLFDENARQAKVPVLALRNVSVVGALQLLAVAAGCRVVPIVDEAGEGEVIGYRILGPQPRPAGPGGGAAWGTGFGGLGGGIEGGIIGEAGGASNTATPAGDAYASAGAGGLGSGGGDAGTSAVPTPGLGGSPGGRRRVVGADSAGHPLEAIAFTAPVPPSAGGGAAVSSTTVYALGPVTGNMKLADIEQALEELLAMNGGGKESATLRIHEATGTLIVRGTGADHQIVAGMLAALSENQAAMAATERAREESDAIQRARQLELELREMLSQAKNLEVRLADAEAAKAELRDELAVLRSTLDQPARPVENKAER